MAGKKPAKSPKLDDAVGEGEEGAPAETEVSEKHQQILERIVSIQGEIDTLNERASEEILHVEQKYNGLRQPHFERRSELIKELPDFWSTALLNHPQFSELFGEEDETVLQYLENIRVDEFEDVKSGYKVSMFFRPNPYFENEVLSKEYALDTNGESMIKGTEIKWKPGKDITEKSVVESKERKRGHEDIGSFFLWFSDLDPSSDEPAELIKDDIWPNPLQFYLVRLELFLYFEFFETGWAVHIKCN
jgi:template-activating factor I